jgi:hypothetical protein
MTMRRAAAAAVAVSVAAAVASCSAAPAPRLESVALPANEITLPVAGSPQSVATPAPAQPREFTADELARIDVLSAAGYWDVHDGTTWEYRITTSTGFQVDATRTSRIVDAPDDGIDLSLTLEYAFVDDRFDPVTIVSDARVDDDGSYRESLQLTYNQAWRRAIDPVFDADFTIPGPSQLQGAGAQPEPIAVGPLGIGPFAEFERSTRTLRTAGAGRMTVLGTPTDVLCFTEVRTGEVEEPDGTTTPFDRRADLCYAQGLGLVHSRTEAGETWEQWTLVASTSTRA